MIYEFRFSGKGSDGRKARGVCEAKTTSELFWMIDRVGDPYDATYRVRRGFCVCLWEGQIEREFSNDNGQNSKWQKFKHNKEY